MLVSLIAFAGTIMLTRLFLELTGYPQLGGGDLHIAHVLWGGLALFIGALLPLIFANRWALFYSSILTGVGMGLFMDEVGKFITSTNDYFFPAAAAIVYIFFLITVLVYLRLRRPVSANPRQTLYRVFDDFSEVLDHDLDPLEHAELDRNLDKIIETAQDENLLRLAASLKDYLNHSDTALVEHKPDFQDRMRARWQWAEARIFSRPRLKLLVVSMLIVACFLAWVELFRIAGPIFNGTDLINAVIKTGIEQGEIRSLAGASWFFVHLVLQALVGLSLLVSVILLVIGKVKRGVHWGITALVASLIIVNVLTFFFEQFSTSAIAVYQLLVLLGLVNYRRRFIQDSVQGI